jgi:uncharacterized protein YdiU (UPF0061 family)
MMAAKLGLNSFQQNRDDAIIKELVAILQLVETDMTIFFRNLSSVETDQDLKEGKALPPPLMEAFYQPAELTDDYRRRMADWLNTYFNRLAQDNSDPDVRQQKMNSSNPKYVLRNYLAQVAIEKAEAGDPSQVINLLELLRKPYEEQPGKEHYAAKRPEWARNRPGCSMLSCSS